MFDYLGAFVAATLLILIVLTFTPSSEEVKIKECEKDLPRTEQCVLIAVPESEVEQTFHHLPTSKKDL